MNLLSNLSNTKMIHTMRTQFAFLLILLGAVSSSSGLRAQAVTGGPGQPEFSSFEPYADGYRVNPLTGNFTYQIPILYVPGPNGGYGMPLFYHAGISADQAASWCGLGWNMNPGAINRSVVGIPDDWRSKKRYIMTYDSLSDIAFNSLSVNVPIEVFTVGMTFDWNSQQGLTGIGLSAGWGPLSVSTYNAQYGSVSAFGLRANFGDNISGGSSGGLPPYVHQNVKGFLIPLIFVNYSRQRVKTWMSMNQAYGNYGLLFSNEGYSG